MITSIPSPEERWEVPGITIRGSERGVVLAARWISLTREAG